MDQPGTGEVVTSGQERVERYLAISGLGSPQQRSTPGGSAVVPQFGNDEPVHPSGGKRENITWQEIQAILNQVNPETGKHYNQSEAAALLGYSRQYISKIKSAAPEGLVSRTAAEISKDDFPIKNCPHPVSTGIFYRLLRYHGIYQEDPKALNERQMLRLRYFHKRLIDKGLIVVYDPSIPPSSDNVFGSFEYTAREPEDGDLVLRDNEHVVYTETSRRIYRLPRTAI